MNRQVILNSLGGYLIGDISCITQVGAKKTLTFTTLGINIEKMTL